MRKKNKEGDFKMTSKNRDEWIYRNWIGILIVIALIGAIIFILLPHTILPQIDFNPYDNYQPQQNWEVIEYEIIGVGIITNLNTINEPCEKPFAIREQLSYIDNEGLIHFPYIIKLIQEN